MIESIKLERKDVKPIDKFGWYKRYLTDNG